MNMRNQIRMSQPEISEFLRDGYMLSVATIGPFGYPDVVAMWYTLVQGQIAFWTYAKSQKVMNLRRDPRLTCMVEAGRTYADLRGVEIKGRATILDDTQRVQEIGEAIHVRYNDHEPNASQRRRIAQQAAKRVAVVVTPVKIISWDHRKLPDEAF